MSKALPKGIVKDKKHTIDFNDIFDSSKNRRFLTGNPRVLEFFKKERNNFYLRDFEYVFQPNLENRKNQGLERVFREHFPIKNQRAKITIKYLNHGMTYNQDETPESCRKNGTSYEMNIILNLQMQYEGKSGKMIKNFSVNMGQVPRMCSNGSIVVNGIDRIVAGLINRSPGALILQKDGNANVKLAPHSGSWIYISGRGNQLMAAIDKKKKFPVSSLLWIGLLSRDFGAEIKKLGEDATEDQIKNAVKITLENNKTPDKFLDDFYPRRIVKKSGDSWKMKIDFENLEGMTVAHDIYSKGKLVCERGNFLQESISESVGPKSSLCGLSSAEEIRSGDKVVIKIGQVIEPEHLEYIGNSFTYYEISKKYPAFLLNGFIKSEIYSPEEALDQWAIASEVNTRGNYEKSMEKFHQIFGEDGIFDLQHIGIRQVSYKLNLKDVKRHLEYRVLVELVKKAAELQLGILEPEDIDHMSNKYLSGPSSTFLVQIQKSLLKSKKATIQKLYALKTFLESDEFSEEKLPRKLSDAVNFKSCTSSINRIIFNLSYLVNHNSGYSSFAQSFKITKQHQVGLKRRPTGNYGDHEIGRICCTKTSEGKNTGVTGYLALGAKIDDCGFILVPYHPVKDGVYDPNEIVYLSAREDMGKVLAFSTSYVENDQGKMVAKDEQVWCIRNGKPRYYSTEEIDYVFVDPLQVFSYGVSIIPGIGNTYAYRLLVGSNMSDQAIGLVHKEKPFIATGMETQYRGGIRAIEAGKVLRVDAKRIIVYNVAGKFDIYKLKNFDHTTSNTSQHHSPVVTLGQQVKKDDLLAEDNISKDNSLALGVNLRICFLSNGHTYEDAVIMNADLHYTGKLSHTAVYRIECKVEDSRSGMEITTSEVPRVPEELRYHLDESGVVNLNTVVKGGDILVGKIIKQNREYSEDEKFMNAILGTKNEDSKDISTRVPEGCSGTVIKVTSQVSKRYEKNDRDLLHEHQLHTEMLADFEDTKLTLWEKFTEDFEGAAGKLSPLIHGVESIDTLLKNPKIQKDTRLLTMCQGFKSCLDGMKQELEIKLAKLREGYDLPSGVVRSIWIDIAKEMNIMKGDKFTNRAGNKGTISKILERHEMPYDSRGRPMDAVFGQLGTISRCNFNQKIEALLALCAHEARDKLRDVLRGLKDDFGNTKLDIKLRSLLRIITGREFVGSLEQSISAAKHFLKNGFSWVLSHFRSLSREKINALLAECELEADGKMELTDGRTGKKFKARVAVGSQLIMKLIHRAQDKYNARSEGPYTASTGQPTGGKKRLGGQRNGEMESYCYAASGAWAGLNEINRFRSGNRRGRKALAKAQDSGGVFSVIFENHRIGTGRAFYMFQKILLAANIQLEVVEKSKLRDIGYKFIRNRLFGEKCAVINLLGDADILRIAKGRVTLPKTIHYNQGRREMGGFYCPKIFGHDKDYTCLCGDIRGTHYLGSTCPKCEITVTNKKTRSERCGYIELPVPMVHPIFINSSSSVISSILGISNRTLKAIKNAEIYYVFEPGSSAFKVGDQITASVFDDIIVVCSDFVALTGGEAIKRLLASVDLLKIIKDQMEIAREATSEIVRMNCDKIINFANYISKSGVNLQNIVFTKLMIVPEQSRQIHQLGGKQFAAPDIVMHYLSIFGRIQRYNYCSEIFGNDEMSEFYPREILRFLRRSIQNAIDLFFTGVANPNSKQQLVSLIHKISGKHGIPRNTLLGRRFNQSGRAVITPNPELKMDEVGISVKMLSVLYRGTVIRLLQKAGYAMDKREAILLIKSGSSFVRHVLEKNIKNMRIMVGRQPSLHKYSIKGLKPVITGRDDFVVGLHPLYCAAYNADFDGDTGQISAMFSVEAKTEISYFMYPSNNMLSAAISDNPVKRLVMKPNKDMIYGLYLLTSEIDDSLEPIIIHHYRDAYFLHEQSSVSIGQPIRFYDRSSNSWQNSTIGRLLFWNIVPRKDLLAFEDFNGVVNNQHIAQIVIRILEDDINNKAAVARFMDKVKDLGFHIANLYGGSFSFLDIPRIEEIHEIVKKTTAIEKSVCEQEDFGFISEKEANRKIIDSWIAGSRKMSACLNRYIEKNPKNPLFRIINSGARGSMTQLNQIAAMIGVSKAFDDSLIVVKENYTDGLDPIAVIMASKSARRECEQVQEKTAESGYTARKLCFLLNQVVVDKQTCNSQEVEYLENIFVDSKLCVSVYDRAFGRTIGEDMEVGEYKLTKNTLITNQIIDLFKEYKIYRVPVMSISGCTAAGICARCYGMNYSTGNFVEVGEGCGVVSAQSISEPFSQLSLGSYHAGGRTNLSIQSASTVSEYGGIVEFKRVKPIEIKGEWFNLGKNAEMNIRDKSGACLATYPVSYGSKILVKDGEEIVEQTRLLAMGKNLEIIAAQEGVCRWDNVYPGANTKMIKRIDENVYDILSTESKQVPVLIVCSPDGKEHFYNIPEGYLSHIKDGQVVGLGDCLARFKQQSKKTLGLVTSLDRILSIIENRNVKQKPALLAPITGTIQIQKHSDKSDSIHIGITPEEGDFVNLGVFSRDKVLVEDGDSVQMGDSLTYGEPTLQSIITYRGIDACRNYVIGEICHQFKLNGANISPKHLDILFRAMTSFFEVSIDPFQVQTKRDIVVVNGQIISGKNVQKLLDYVKNNNKQEMNLRLHRRIFGVQQATQQKCDSFLSQISFQHPKTNLGNAILLGSRDLEDPQRLDNLNSLQASLICNTNMPIGTNVVRRQFKNMIRNDKKYQSLLNKLSNT
jgi:DNA-directed RNA polymerase beta subunit/DNA-directed RNA polymerase beta' subunit